MTGSTATIEVDETTLPVDRIPATVGNDGIGISTLLSKTGVVTYDPGFMNTAACQSEITYIDGDEGILRYRGYPIEQLAEKSNYLEVSYLLIYGELPTPEQLAAFDGEIRRHTLLHEDMRHYFEGVPHTAHPMAVLSGGLQTMSTYYEDSLDTAVPEFVEVNQTSGTREKRRTIRSRIKWPSLISARWVIRSAAK